MRCRTSGEIFGKANEILPQSISITKVLSKIADDQYSEDRVKRCLLQSSGFCRDTKSNIQITEIHQTSTAINVCIFLSRKDKQNDFFC